MRRASGPQTGLGSFYLRKENANKIKSPSHAKIKSRGKIVQEASTSHVIPTRKGNSFSKIQPNQSSTFFTTQNNRSKKSQFGVKKAKDLKKYQKQIMQVLHTSASIIQRQWRKYLIRKYRKSLQEKKAKKQQKKPIQHIQFDSISGRTSQNSQAYNSKKYCLVGEQNKMKAHQNSFNKNVFSFNLSDKKTKHNLSPEKYEKPNVQPRMVLGSQTGHNRTRSDEPAVTFLSTKSKIKNSSNCEEKCLQIAPNIINIVIQNHSPEKRKKKIKSNQSISSKQQIKYQDHYVKNQKGALDQILKKLEHQLQQKKLKKILALQNSFGSNLMTFRSYQKNIENVAEQHNKKLTLLQNKKKKLLDKFNQFIYFCENNLEQHKQQQQDDKMSQPIKRQKAIPPTQNHHIDLSFSEQISGLHSRSMAFDDWDLDGQFSDKKLPEMTKKNIQSGKKEDQILIDQSQKDSTVNNTIINQLISNEDTNFSGSKNNNSHQKFIKQEFQLIERPGNKIESNVILIQNNQEVLKPQPQDISKKLEQKQIQPTEKLSQITKTQSPQKKQQLPQKLPIDQLNKPKQSNSNIKQFSEQEIKQQLKKFHPIKPNIDVVNNWLLEISHFILDNFGGEFLKKLICVQQPDSTQMFKFCVSGESFIKQYCSVTQKVFKQFQFFHIKTIITDESVQNDKKQSFSALMYTFHQALYDCLNKMLLDQLIEGRNWIKFPWSNQFKVKKLIGPDHSKQSLQKAINRVSNISDYNITPIDPSIQFGRQFEQTQHNLIFAQQIKQIPLQCQIQRGHILYKISKIIEQQIIEQQIKMLRGIF